MYSGICDMHLFGDRDGFTNMWGRSIIYRNAANSAFAGNAFLQNSKLDPGRARRVASGSLMQFLGREDFRFEGVPTLGFYGQFMPLVQAYSCSKPCKKRLRELICSLSLICIGKLCVSFETELFKIKRNHSHFFCIAPGINRYQNQFIKRFF